MGCSTTCVAAPSTNNSPAKTWMVIASGCEVPLLSSFSLLCPCKKNGTLPLKGSPLQILHVLYVGCHCLSLNHHGDSFTIHFYPITYNRLAIDLHSCCYLRCCESLLSKINALPFKMMMSSSSYKNE